MKQRIDSKPWYRQFWPWFIIALPASVVVAGLITVFIAFRHADTLVNDNYYKDGLAINQTLAQDTRARELGVEATIDFDRVTGEVFAPFRWWRWGRAGTGPTCNPCPGTATICACNRGPAGHGG